LFRVYSIPTASATAIATPIPIPTEPVAAYDCLNVL
jgi:hypothetical protein